MGCFFLFDEEIVNELYLYQLPQKAIKNEVKKNRVKVALSTANPPHIHCTRSPPIYGIAENKFVITVAPQKDICPQGNT